MSVSIVFDTSVYIRALRQGRVNVLNRRNTGERSGSESFPLWLSAVVLEELYAGASNKTALKSLAKFEKDFIKINRLLVPNQTAWSTSGQILNRIGEKYGFEKIGKARLTNDALLATSAARTGLTVLTANTKDFNLISEFCRFKWEIV